MKHRSGLFVVLLIAVVWVAGCAAQPASHGGPVADYASLIDALRTGGATVESAGAVSQPFFSVAGRVIRVEGADVQIFEYENEEMTEADAAKISPDGSSIGTSMVTWVSTPHFYKAGKLIVLYVGDDAGVIAALDAALGAEFAGRGES
ncbi:MAG TPA: hypothetical protein VJ793_16865 [Anaerolineae bacterium]|nr:hypothetical protein [Anaerolineae bacterium]